MSTDGSQSEDQPKPRKVFGNAAGHRQAQQAVQNQVQNPVQAQQPVQPVVQPPVQPVVQQPVQPALVRRQAFINRLANAQPNQNPVLGGALGQGRAQAQQAVVNNQAPVQQAPVQQPVVNQPPVRPVGQSPQIPPPKLLRERSEKEMKESQKQHNLDRMQKLNNLSAGADIYCTNYSKQLAKSIKSPGQHFQAVTQSLQACEAQLTAANLNTLKADAQSCLTHLNQQNAMARLAPEHGAKKLACEQLLERIPQAECRITLAALGPADAWGLAEENTAASVYSKLLFEAGDSVVKPGDKKKAPSRTMAKPNVAEGKTTANASWWVEKQVGDGDKGKKKFIFKPAELGDQIAGFPDGGSPCREVLGKAVANQLQACMGIDFGAPETLLVNVAKDRLAGYEGGDPSQSETVGSMQHFSKSDGEFGDLIDKDPTLLQRISKEDCQKMAVLDLVSLNMDRHSGNFMVAGAQGAQPKLIPIDHGLVMPSRAGLRERATRLGPPNTALSKIPASEDPFTPEMAARVAAIDPDEVVKGLRATQQVMQGQHKAVADKADIKDENFNLVKRSCEFLKAGVAAGLSPAELSDAYLRHQDSIFDTPDDNTKPAAFARVIADVQAKSPMRQKALKALPTPDHCIPVADELVKLGWDVPSFTKEAKAEAKAGLFQMILTNPLLYDMQQNKTPNPFLQQEIDDLEQQCIAEGIDVVAKKNAKGNDVPMAYRKTLMNNLSSTQLRKRNAQADLDAKALPGGVFAKNTHKEVYAECFLADGGAAKLANASGDPMENLKAYMDAEEQRWNLSGLAKKFNESFPEEEEDTAQPTKADNGSGDGAKANATTDASPNAVTIKRCKRFKLMRAFAQYEAEGGNSDYEALGCDKSIPYDSPSARLKELRSAKKLKAQLKALEDLAKPQAATATAQPNQPVQPVQPTGGTKKSTVGELKSRTSALNLRIAQLDGETRNNTMKRLVAAMQIAVKGQMDEATQMLDDLEDELEVQEANRTS